MGKPGRSKQRPDQAKAKSNGDRNDRGNGAGGMPFGPTSGGLSGRAGATNSEAATRVILPRFNLQENPGLAFKE